MGQHCNFDEGSVDLATTGFVTSQINQTSFVFKFTNTLGAGAYADFWACGTGWIASDPSISTSPVNEISNGAITPHSWMNVGEVNTGIPNDRAEFRFDLSATETMAHHVTCTDGRVYGLAGPALPISKAMAQATAGTKAVS